MIELPKAYNPQETESRIYKLWEESGFFNPDNLPDKGKGRFSMVLPPPNVTGTLHLGHAVTVTIEDILVRYQRMLGKKTLWLPGTDHAAIATESKIEKELIKKEGKNRNDLGRPAFLKRVDAFAKESQQTILNQLRKMGASLDWSRLAFTLDEKRQRAVYTAFKRMYDAGLIYHGEYLINWDKKGQTTVSDEEVEYETTKGTLYTFRYSKNFPFPIASTRPETKLGDVAVAVHPSGKWKEYIGKKFEIDNFVGTKLTIEVVGDEAVDPEFGTGAVGITPAHSKVDAEIAQRHNLPSKQVINEFGKIMHTGSGLDTLNIQEARDRVVEWLKNENLLEKEEIIEHNIAKAQRSGGIIEILPKRHQFFVNVNKPIVDRDGKTLRELMCEAVTTGKIKIIPERFEKNYFHWIDTLRDWNISRQVWYGHRIPAWCKGEEIKVEQESPGEGWEPIEDTFDTWFSSGLWTFSTLGWPDETMDLKTYHPTDVLETGYDILFFWVARMILMSSFLLGEVPFHTVYLHGLVRDENRKKMSKSLGNVIDPLVMTEKYGTDALRMALIFNTASGTDSVISEEKIKGMKHFANKFWNIARFILMNNTGVMPSSKPKARTDADRVILEQLSAVRESVSRNIEQFQLHEAAQAIYQFIWHDFADVYLEASKPQLKNENKENTEQILLHTLCTTLKLLHPFMPFVTEEIYAQLPITDKKLLLVEEWPR
ncbi:MAG: valine--tRNA ligase [Patescibacteria group bacterium]